MNTSVKINVGLRHESGGEESFLCLQITEPCHRAGWMPEFCFSLWIWQMSIDYNWEVVIGLYTNMAEAELDWSFPWTQTLLVKKSLAPHGALSSWHIYSLNLFWIHWWARLCLHGSVIDRHLDVLANLKEPLCRLGNSGTERSSHGTGSHNQMPGSFCDSLSQAVPGLKGTSIVLTHGPMHVRPHRRGNHDRAWFFFF